MTPESSIKNLHYNLTAEILYYYWTYINIWILGILVFLARIVDVSVGKLRTINIMQGRTEE